MKSNDLTLELRMSKLREDMQQAFVSSDVAAFNQALDGMLELKSESLVDAHRQEIEQLTARLDSQVLVTRGVNVLTAEERKYFTQFAEAAASMNPKQAVEGLAERLPRTTINRVFEDLRANHPLLSELNFVAAPGLAEIVVNTNGYQEAAWGALCDEVVKELTSGFKVVNAVLLKVTAFLPVCKAMLDLGPEWIERFAREILMEALANGLEAGYVAGTGKNMPIGMIRNVAPGVSITDGVYPEKASTRITDLLPVTVGGLLGKLAVDTSGKSRAVRNIIFVVNPSDYYTRVMPATTLMAPDGSYRNDVMPVPMKVIQSPSVPAGKAIFGLGKRYVGLLGTAKEGRIEYSDHYRFLEDERVYLIKAYANGFPLDDNDFLLLDIAELEPILWTVVQAADAAST